MSEKDPKYTWAAQSDTDRQPTYLLRDCGKCRLTAALDRNVSVVVYAVMGADI